MIVKQFDLSDVADGGGLAKRPDDQINLAPSKISEQFVIPSVNHHHRIARPLFTEPRQGAWQKNRTRQRQATDHNLPRFAAVQFGQITVCLIKFGKGQHHRLHQRAGLSRGQKAKGRAFKQALARFLFKLRNSAVHGWLGQTQTAGGKGKVFGLMHRDQRLKLSPCRRQHQARRDIGQRGVKPIKRAAQTTGQHFASRGREDALTGAIKQTPAGFAFQFPNGLGDGRLRHIQDRRGMGQRTCFRHR